MTHDEEETMQDTELSESQKRTVEALAFQIAGAATAPLLEDNPDYVFPTEKVKEAVENVLRTFGLEPGGEWPDVAEALDRLALRQHRASLQLANAVAILRGEVDGLGELTADLFEEST